MNFLLVLTLFASIINNGPFVVEADKATSSGGKLELAGHIKIQTGVLKAEAEEASCTHDQTGPMLLRKDVSLTVENYGKVTCDSALLNPQDHEAIFSSLTKPVVYEDVKNGLVVSAKEMSLLFTEQAVESFKAQQNVEALWRYGISCSAEEALFTPSTQTVIFDKAHIIAQERADLHCRKASFKTKGGTIYLEEVTGFFNRAEKLYVTSDTMSYHEPLVHLQGHVHLTVSLDAGPAVLSNINSCQIDDLKHTITITPNMGDRLLLEAPYGTLKAGSIDLFYEQDAKEYKLKSFVLKGNVEIANNFSFKDPETAVNRYALADIVEVDCFDRVMTLKSRENKRVLFFDEEKKVQVSADAIAVCYRDGQEEISGKGAVRMLFNESELSRLTEHFHK